MISSADTIRTRWGRLFSFRERGWAYKQVFQSQAALIHVLPDLAEFCGAADLSPLPSAALSLERAAGRRDVWLRISHQINLTEEELYALLRGQPKQREDGT